jgi:hypothetical protein
MALAGRHGPEHVTDVEIKRAIGALLPPGWWVEDYCPMPQFNRARVQARYTHTHEVANVPLDLDGPDFVQRAADALIANITKRAPRT